MHVQMYVIACIYLWPWRPKVNINIVSVFHDCFPTSIWRQGLSFELAWGEAVVIAQG